MTNQEREFIIVKREECRHLMDNNNKKTWSNLAAFVVVGAVSVGITILTGGKIDPASQAIFSFVTFLPAGMFAAFGMSAANGYNKSQKDFDDYDKLLNGLENEQEIEKEGKSR